jgi:putative ABC transport system permease protein
LEIDMDLLNIIRVAFRALIRNKMRAALTMLGIIIGVAAVIAMVSIGQGASASVQAQIESIGTNLLFVSAGAQNVGGVRSGTGDTGTNTLTVDDLQAIKREVPSVSMVTPNVNARSQLVAGNMNWNTAVTGVSEEYPEIRKWPVANGSFFTDADVRTAARVIVIGQTLADNLYPGTDPIGQDIRVLNLPFRIVGVMARKGQDPQGRDQDDVAFAPYTTVQKKILGRDRVQIAFVSAISQDATYTAQSQITELLRQRHKLAASEPNDFTVRNMTDVAEAANETSKTMTILLACIAGVSLLVGGIGIMNIMLVSVTERTREIGIRMAIGARSSAVRSQFLIESIVLSLTGGMVGIILGVAFSLAIPAFLGWPTLVSMMAIIGSALFSAAVGIFFGYYPARKAASLDPIEALRYE